jgi:hypothetical protein
MTTTTMAQPDEKTRYRAKDDPNPGYDCLMFAMLDPLSRALGTERVKEIYDECCAGFYGEFAESAIDDVLIPDLEAIIKNRRSANANER